MVLIVVVTHTMSVSEGGKMRFTRKLSANQLRFQKARLERLKRSVSGVLSAQRVSVIHSQQVCRMPGASGLGRPVVFA